MNIPNGARINFFSSGHNGRFEIAESVVEKVPQPISPRPDPDQARIAAYERLRIREQLDPTRIYQARAEAGVQLRAGEPSPQVTAPGAMPSAADIYAARRMANDR